MLGALRDLFNDRSAQNGQQLSPRPTPKIVGFQPLTPSIGQIGRYAKGTEGLRATAKWLLAVLAAVGTVLLAGLQLTKLGELHGQWLRLAIALAASAAALSAVGYMIAATSRIFTDPWVTLDNLDNEALDQSLVQAEEQARGEPRPARNSLGSAAVPPTIPPQIVGQLEERVSAPGRAGDNIGLTPERSEKIDYEMLRGKVERDRQWLYRHVAAGIPELHRKLRKANDAARSLPSGAEGVDQLAALRAATAEVVDCANYHHVRLILRGLRPRLAWATAVVVIAILIFAYATNPPAKPSGPIKVQIVPSGGQ
jgi:hypothetical protein